MLVEFIGTSGAGKTTLLTGVLKELRRRQVPVEHVMAKGSPRDRPGQRARPARRLVESLGAAVSQPALAAWCLTDAVLGGNRRNLKRKAWVCRSSRTMRRLAGRAGVVLVDEGPMKNVPLLLAEGVRDPDRLLRLVPVPDLYVRVTVDPDTAIERVRRRGNTHSSDDEIRRRHLLHARGFDLVDPRAPVDVVDTAGPDQTLVVADRIEALWAARRPEAVDPGVESAPAGARYS